MRSLRAWVIRWAGLFGRARRDRELGAEIQSHLQMHIDDNLRAGMTPEEARRNAILAFGGVEAVKERYRDRRGIPAVETLLQDVGFGARMLRKYPAFTVVAMLTVALGVGPNTAIFTLLNAVLLRPLPYPESDRLVALNESDRQRDISVSYLNYQDWIRQQTVFERLALFRTEAFTLTGRGEPERLVGAIATADLFPMLGFVPELGHGFSPDDDRGGSERKVVLAHALWQRRFGRDPHIVGQTLALDGLPYSIVGVMSNLPSVPRGAELWTSLGPLVPGAAYRLRANHMGFTALGRLGWGVTLERARIGMATITSRLAAQYPDANANNGIVLTPMLEWLVGEYRRGLLLLEVAVGLVLLVACANFANLLFAQGATRHQELAMRVALGAGRRRLVRQLLTESSMVAFAGGAIGVLLARWSFSAILALAPPGAARFADAQIDWRVCAFAAAMSLGAGLLAGSWPAWRLARTAGRSTIEDTGRGSTDGPRRWSMRHALVASEVALTLVLLVAAVLLVRSLARLQSVPLGFDPKGLLMMTVDLSPVRYDEPARVNAFYDELLARARTLPGVRGATLNSAAPLGANWQTRFEIEDRPPFALNQRPSVEVSVIDAGYFSVLGIPLLKGRPFGRPETIDSPKVIIIDEAFAQRIWPGEDALGKRLRFWQGSPFEAACTVVGIVPTVRLYGYGVEPHLLQAYFPQVQMAIKSPTVLVRSKADHAALASTLRDIAHDLDANAPVRSVRTLEQDLADSVSSSRLLVFLLMVFAALAVLLASVGLYGMVSYGISAQTREIGVRLALGAQASEVLWMVLRQGARPALIGVALGLAGALAMARVLRGLLFGISPADPATLAGVTTALILGVLLACYVPARRATRVDPVIALR